MVELVGAGRRRRTSHSCRMHAALASSEWDSPEGAAVLDAHSPPTSCRRRTRRLGHLAEAPPAHRGLAQSAGPASGSGSRSGWTPAAAAVAAPSRRAHSHSPLAGTAPQQRTPTCPGPTAPTSGAPLGAAAVLQRPGLAAAAAPAGAASLARRHGDCPRAGLSCKRGFRYGRRCSSCERARRSAGAARGWA